MLVPDIAKQIPRVGQALWLMSVPDIAQRTPTAGQEHSPCQYRRQEAHGTSSAVGKVALHFAHDARSVAVNRHQHLLLDQAVAFSVVNERVHVSEAAQNVRPPPLVKPLVCPRHLLHRLLLLPGSLGMDEVIQSFRFEKVHPPVQERPLCELSSFC
eukprot:928831-Rhodomonas_salina.2